MKYWLLLCVFFMNGIAMLRAADGDTTKILVHNDVDMTWYGNYDQVGVFPNTNTTYRKILMHYTLGCASGGCSGWDYTTQMFFMQPTGRMDSTVSRVDTISTNPLVTDTTWSVFEVMIPMELGRVITPYGTYMANGQQGYNNNWTHTYTFDVTDFAPLLRDSALIRAFYSGWSSGFSVTLQFDFIEGTPPYDVVDIQTVYKGEGTYNNSADFEANFFAAKQMQVAQAAGGRLYVTATGHGFDNNVNCAEFCVRSYAAVVNAANVGTRTIWKDDCGSNPIYPQGGTWLYDRAGWCPGSKADIHVFNVSNALQYNTLNTIDLNMQNYAWSGNQAPSYTIDARLVTHGAPNFQRDISLEAIVSPSNQDANYKRVNPICNNPVIRFRNTGADTVRSATFEYGVDGAAECVYTWNGALGFMDELEISLPSLNWQGINTTSPRFRVRVVDVNGAADGYASNNALESTFAMPDRYDLDSIKVYFRTNAAATETSYQLFDGSGNVVFQRIPTASGGTFNDVLYLADGCYTLRVTDSDGDGLSWWANSDGSGNISFMNPRFQNILKSFNADFGNFIEYAFVIGANYDNMPASACVPSAVTGVAASSFAYSLFPNPSSDGHFTVQTEFVQIQKELQLSVYNVLGVCVFQQQANDVAQFSQTFDWSHLPNGIYTLRLATNSQQAQQQFIIAR